MNNKTRDLVFILGLFLVFVGVGLAFDSRQISPKNLPKQVPVPVPLKTADLQVSWIQAWPCACENLMSKVDAMIVKGRVIVRVANAGPLAAKAGITAKVFFRESGLVFDSPAPIHLEANQHADVVLFESFRQVIPMLLIKKSLGIEVKVDLTSKGMFDPNTSNNTKKITACNYVIE